MAINAGIGYEIIKNLLFLFDMDKYFKEKGSVFKFGLEYSVFDILFLRVGDKIENGKNVFSLGGGIEYKIKNLVLSADYGFSLQTSFNNIHAFSLKIGF